MREGASGALHRLAAALEEAVSDLWRRRPFVAATIAAIGVTLTFPALAVTVLDWTGARVQALASGQRLRVFLLPEATESEVTAVEEALRRMDGLADVVHVSAAEAKERFARRFPELARLPAELSDEELALPASVEARLEGGESAAAAAAAAARELPGVEDVRHDAAWGRELARVSATLAAARAAVLTLALLVTSFGIANVVRIDALSRREELAIQRLVGAPGLHLRLPFVVAGAAQGAAGGAVAALALAAIVAAGRVGLAALLPAARAGVPAGTAVTLVLGGAAAGALGAAVAVEGVLRRHARLER